MNADHRPTRRALLSAAAAAAALPAARLLPARTVEVPPAGLPPGVPFRDYLPVITPNGAALPFRVVESPNGAAKVFHLIAEPVTHTFTKGLVGECWGYNGRVHGPTIEAVEGDRVRVYVTNKLPVATTVHWHGLFVPSGMDGVGGLSQRPIEPGETFRYEFVLRQHGTLMYHAHHDEMTQMAMGLMGLFVVHPRAPVAPAADRDFAFLLSEWHMEPGTRRPDPNEMADFNVLTLNGVVFPKSEPMVVRTGQRVRIRFGNLSAMDHHPMHLHGNAFTVVATDGGVIPESARWPETTVLVPVGSTRTVEFVADNPGDWALHCHMTHHVMTQMGHGIPNLVGLDATASDEAVAKAVPWFETMGEGAGMAGHGGVGGPGGEPQDPGADATIPPNSVPMLGGKGPFGGITMSGMFTILKVRDGITEYGDPGWYAPPEGTLARPATEDELRDDGVEPK